VLLGELARARMDPSLVEDVLNGLKDVLSTGRRGGVGVLLATHDDFHNFAQLHRRQVFGLLDLVDL
jgi:hypothetical protein